MAEIYGDGISLPARILLAGSDGADLSSPLRTILASSDGGASSFPFRTISASGSFLDFLVDVLPVKSLSAAVSNQFITLDATLPQIVGTGEIASGEIINASLALPLRLIDAAFAVDIAINLPIRVLIAELASGASSSADIRLPGKDLQAFSEVSGILLAENTLPGRVLAGNLLSGNIGGLSDILPKAFLVAESFSGSIGSLIGGLPLKTLLATIFGGNSLSADIRLPLKQIDAALLNAVLLAHKAWVLNTRKGALTRYESFPFNSVAVFQGKVFAASSSGIYELGVQDNDHGVAINALIKTGQHDFETSFLKRVPRAYVGYKAAGDMEFHTITSHDGARKYLLASNNLSSIQQRRIPIGKGPKARYWQFAMANRGGADFLIESILVYPDTLTRRVF